MHYSRISAHESQSWNSGDRQSDRQNVPCSCSAPLSSVHLQLYNLTSIHWSSLLLWMTHRPPHIPIHWAVLLMVSDRRHTSHHSAPVCLSVRHTDTLVGRPPPQYSPVQVLSFFRFYSCPSLPPSLPLRQSRAVLLAYYGSTVALPVACWGWGRVVDVEVGGWPQRRRERIERLNRLSSPPPGPPQNHDELQPTTTATSAYM